MVSTTYTHLLSCSCQTATTISTIIKPLHWKSEGKDKLTLLLLISQWYCDVTYKEQPNQSSDYADVHTFAW